MTVAKRSSKQPGSESNLAASSLRDYNMITVKHPATAQALRRVRSLRWNDAKSRAVDLLLLGASNRFIARQVGANRGTVNAWMHHPEFQQEARRRLQQHLDAYRQRRLRETNDYANRVATFANAALMQAELDPANEEAARAAQIWLSEYRALRAEERRDFGDGNEPLDMRGTLPAEAVPNEGELRAYLDVLAGERRR